MKIRAIKSGSVGDRRIRRNVEAVIDKKDFNPKWMELLEDDKPKKKKKKKKVEKVEETEEPKTDIG